jgi:hypothetical protein
MLSKKLSRYSSHDKLSQCRDWRGDWGKKIKVYSQNLANSKFKFIILEFPKTGFDFKVMAEKEI